MIYVLIRIFLLLAASHTVPSQPPQSHLPSTLSPTACSIVTRADVEDALGRRVDHGKPDVDGPESICDYTAKGGMVSVALQKLSVKPNLAVEAAALKKEIPEAVIRAAPGFPDGFYLDIPDAGTQLHVIIGGSEHLMVSILGFGDPSRVSAAAAQIARRAMQRL